MLTETGRLIRVILVAMVCDKPAAHKMGGFASHSHTNFCSLCWISVQDKGKPSAFQHEGVTSLSDSISYPHPPQHSAIEQTRTTADLVMTIVNYRLLQPGKTSSKSTQRDTRNFPTSHISIWSSKLLLTQCTTFFLVNLLLAVLLFYADPHIGLVKTHFYGIWVQKKILRPNHELVAFHSILADVKFFLRPLITL